LFILNKEKNRLEKKEEEQLISYSYREISEIFRTIINSLSRTDDESALMNALNDA
jgi:hypothetical protein